MEEFAEIKLSLGNNESVSQLKKTVYEEELNEINSKVQLEKGDLDIQCTFLLKNENNLETGFFIRNGLEEDVSLENVLLLVEDESGEILTRKQFNFKNYGVIPGFSARPFEVTFELPDNIEYDESKEYIIKFGAVNTLESFSSVATKVANIPENMPFEQEKALRDFENSLPTLKTDEFSINPYQLSYDKNRSLYCTLILRNGYNSEVKLEKLPINVISKDGNVVARAIFSNNQGIINVAPRTSMLMTMQFPAKNVAPGIHDLKNCIVECK